MLDKRKFYINGQWVDPSKKNDFEVINPSDESVCAMISLGSQADTDAAVSAARSALPMWSNSSKEDRVALLERLYACLLYTSPSPRDQRGSRMPSSA